jgi:cytoskeleton protein RodZ
MSEVAQTLSLGQRLKAERERRAMSTQKAADEMHLDAWVIEALEAGDYQRIGPPVYAKGHLKKYASILGLPSAEILAAFDTNPPAPAANAAPQSSVRMHTAAPPAANLPWPQLAAVAIIALIVVGILWWRPWHQRSATPATQAQSTARPSAATIGEPDVQRPDGPPSEDTVPTESPAAPGAAAGPAPPAAPGATDAAASPATIPAVLSKSAGAASDVDATRAVGRARLRLSFSADSWVDVHDAEGRRVFAGNGRANSVKTIAGMAPLRVYLGFASGVQLQVNDRAVAIGPQFLTGDVARFEAGADGVLRRDARATPNNGAQTHAAPPRG